MLCTTTPTVPLSMTLASHALEIWVLRGNLQTVQITTLGKEKRNEKNILQPPLSLFPFQILFGTLEAQVEAQVEPQQSPQVP